MIHFQGHDDVHEFLTKLIQRAEEEAQSDLARCSSDWSVEEATNWLVKVRTAQQHLADCILVNRAQVNISWMPDPCTMSTLVKAQVRIGTGACVPDGLRPEAFYRAVSEVETAIREYLFDPPKPVEQTPPVQP